MATRQCILSLGEWETSLQDYNKSLRVTQGHTFDSKTNDTHMDVLQRLVKPAALALKTHDITKSATQYIEYIAALDNEDEKKRFLEPWLRIAPDYEEVQKLFKF